MGVNSMSRWTWKPVLCLCVVLSARAQDPVGTVEGEVRDASQARIAAARVTVTNHDTGLKRETLSNEEGLFRVPLLPVGDYTLEVEAGRKRLHTVEPQQARFQGWELLGHSASAFSPNGQHLVVGGYFQVEPRQLRSAQTRPARS